MGSLKKEGEMEQIGDEFTEAILYVNGVRRVLPDGLAHMTLLEYLRDLGLTGTKLGCGEGGCGACTVMVSNYDRTSNKCIHYAVNACLAPLYSVEGMHVISIEGVGQRKHGLHPLQESLASSHGSQCGFCTPGFIMSMYALLRSNKNSPSEEDIEESLAGNLCRCTGYRPIVDAFRVFAKTDDALYSGLSSLSLQDGSSICPSTGKPCSCGDGRYQPISYSETDGAKYTEKELIFPPELLLRKLASLKLRGDGGMIWYRPVRLQYLLRLKAKHPEAKLVVGNTEVGIEMRLKRLQYQVLIYVGQVPELNTVNVNDSGVEIGSALRLSELLRLFKNVVKERPAHETSACKAFTEQLKWFAGTQIRNVASVGGNICTASPISDLNPPWMASRAEFKIINCYGDVRSVRARDFFSGYRKVDMESNEILLSVFIPWTRPLEYVKEFKQAHRREDDIAIVNGGMRVFLEERGQELFVSDASVAFGGVAPVTLRARNTEEFLIGKSWSKGLLQDALKVIQSDVLIDEDAPGGMVEFRKSLVLSFFFKFFLWVSHHVRDVKPTIETFPPSHMSAVQSFSRPCRAGRQDYETVKQGTAVGLPEVHLSARMQVTGEAEYTDDTPVPPNTLHAALVLSKMPHARIISIDDSESKSSRGFAGLFLAKDVPADNKIGPVVADEELFATDVVTCVGQVIGVVVADTHENAILPAILSIKEAIAAKSFHPNTEKMLKKGDVEICFQSGQCAEPVLPPVSARPEQVEKVLKTRYHDAMAKLSKGKEIDLLIVILPDNNGSLYGDLKRICETELGIVSQCCLTKHVFKMSKQYMANVALKINVKVGGRNTVLVDALSRRIPLVSDRPTIIFGADVTHPHPGEDSSPSIAAVVASQDWPEITKYAGLVCAQAHRQELIQDLFKEWKDPQKGVVTGGMIKELLIAFRRSTGHKPLRIIFYRDGVSEGQFYQVLLYELDAIRKACASLEAGYQPPVTFVVVQKRHHTRLFAHNHNDRNSVDRSGNILPGTVVDSKICHPTEFVFAHLADPGHATIFAAFTPK